MDYILAIDETGSFNILNNKDNSFVCGVLMPKNDEMLKNKFIEAYKKCKFSEIVPDDTKYILKNSLGKELFHYCELSAQRKEELKDVFLHPESGVFHKVFVSDGRPIVFANNQNWWQIALMCVIKKAISSLAPEDELEILIDQRSMIVLGIGFGAFRVAKDDKKTTSLSIPYKRISELCVDHIGKSSLSLQIDSKDCCNDAIKIEMGQENISITMSKKKTKDSDSFISYHGVIQKQLENCFPNRKIGFSSGTINFYVALADIACGFINDKYYKQAIKCPCAEYMIDIDDDIENLWQNKPQMAMSIIFQEILNNKFEHHGLIAKIIDNENLTDNDREKIWDDFQNMLKYKIDIRDLSPRLDKVVTVFLHNFREKYLKEKNNLPKNNSFLDIFTLFLKYYSHIGSNMLPFKMEIVQNICKNENIDSRIAMRWLKYISILLSYTQICYNRYDFETPLDSLEEAFRIQSEAKNMFKDFVGDKDENCTALLGSIAQAYAFNGRYVEAMKSFEESTKYAVRTQTQTNSFMLTIAHLQKDKNAVVEYFNKCVKVSPRQYYIDGDFNNPDIPAWNLLAYCKLRALDLFSESPSLDLDGINLSQEYKGSREYPFPMAQKWEGIAQMIDKYGNKKIAAENFEKAIAKLQNSHQFTLKTLSLPIIQCLARIEPDNEYCRNYAQYVQELTKQSKTFAEYMDKHAEFKEINTEASLWDCATFLPFIYS